MSIRAARTDIGIAKALATTNHNATENSATFDCSPWNGVVVALNLYTQVSTGGNCVLRLQDSADGSTNWTDVSGMSYTLPAITTTQTAAGWVFLTSQVRRYVRIVSAVPGSSSWIGGVQWIGHEPKDKRPSGFEFALDGATDIT